MWTKLLNVSLMILLPIGWGLGMAWLVPRLRRRRPADAEEFVE